MFNLRLLELAHWDYWERMTVPLDRSIITLTGPNGAGKTTFIDACRTLLSIECSANRDYKRYVRRTKASTAWLRGVVTNPISARRVRAFFPIQSEEVTLICRIRRASGDWERKYAIVPGNVTIEAIEASEPEWIGVREYGTRMQEAGLTTAMRKVLALDQGATDKLSEYSSQQLLRLVFDTYGDQAVLDDYQRAKSEYEDASHELEETERQVNLQKAATLRLEQEMMMYREWCTRRDRWLRWESLTLPLLKTHEAFTEWLTSNKDRRISRGKLRATRDRVQSSEQSLLEKAEHVRVLTERLKAQRTARQLVEAEFGDLKQTYGRLEQILQERTRLETMAAPGPSLDTASATREVASLRKLLAQLDLEQESLIEQSQALEEQRSALESGKRPSWPAADAFRLVLKQAGIAHVPLVEALEVDEARWQPAVEGVLGALRGMVVLKRPDDQRAAFELGQRHRYRFLIAPFAGAVRTATAGRLLAQVRVTSHLPPWLGRFLDDIHCVETVAEGVELNRRIADAVWVTPDGYYREHRGGRFTGERPENFLLGEAGAQAALSAVRAQLHGITERLRSIRAEQTEKSARLSHLESTLQGIDAAQQLLARTEEFHRASEEMERCKDTLFGLADRVSAETTAEHQISDALRDASVEQNTVQQRLKAERDQADSAQAEFTAKVQTSRDNRLRLKQFLKPQPANWREPTWREATLRADGYLDSSSEILQRVTEDERKWVESRRGTLNEAAEFLHQKQTEELARLELLLAERREMRERTLALVDQQRAVSSMYSRAAPRPTSVMCAHSPTSLESASTPRP